MSEQGKINIEQFEKFKCMLLETKEKTCKKDIKDDKKENLIIPSASIESLIEGAEISFEPETYNKKEGKIQKEFLKGIDIIKEAENARVTNNAEYWLHRGNCYSIQKQTELAIGCYRQGLRLVRHIFISFLEQTPYTVTA